MHVYTRIIEWKQLLETNPDTHQILKQRSSHGRTRRTCLYRSYLFFARTCREIFQGATAPKNAVVNHHACIYTHDRVEAVGWRAIRALEAWVPLNSESLDSLLSHSLTHRPIGFCNLCRSTPVGSTALKMTVNHHACIYTHDGVGAVARKQSERGGACAAPGGRV
jgi:hypothetical protein